MTAIIDLFEFTALVLPLAIVLAVFDLDISPGTDINPSAGHGRKRNNRRTRYSRAAVAANDN